MWRQSALDVVTGAVGRRVYFTKTVRLALAMTPTGSPHTAANASIAVDVDDEAARERLELYYEARTMSDHTIVVVYDDIDYRVRTCAVCSKGVHSVRAKRVGAEGLTWKHNPVKVKR